MSDDAIRRAAERVTDEFDDTIFCEDVLLVEHILRTELADIIRDAVRWRWVETEHVRAVSVHMDGTSEYVFHGWVERARTVGDAVDAARKERT